MRKNETRGFQIGGEPGDLFAGTAAYYAQFRRQCPTEVVSYLVDHSHLDGHGRLLDIGCGTGQVFLPLAKYFDGIVAIDADEDMVRHARKVAGEIGARHITVMPMRGEEINDNLGSFRMVTFGLSFHWMDRARVSDLVYKILEPAAWMVIFCPGEIHSGKTIWETEIRTVLREWLGPERRAGGGLYRQGEPHAQILENTSFVNIQTKHFPVHQEWSIDEIAGYLFSTSYASAAILGEKREEFERAIRERLMRLAPDGRFKKVVEYTVISAQRPA